jgi:hypothetical protein
MELDWLPPHATPDMLAAEARECNERLRAVAASVQHEVLALAAMVCNKPSLHAANLELELSSRLATAADARGSPARGAGAEAAARIQAERHYQAALSHVERGSESLGPACRALRDARATLAPHDSLSATPMSPSSLEPALPGVMSGDDGGVSLASISHLQTRVVKMISDEVQRCMIACGEVRAGVSASGGGSGRRGGTEYIGEAVEMLSALLSREQVIIVLGNALNKSLQTVLALDSVPGAAPHARGHHLAHAHDLKREMCELIVEAASVSVPAALASAVPQTEWERSHHDIFLQAARKVLACGASGEAGAEAASRGQGPLPLGRLLKWSHRLVLSLHFASAKCDRLLPIHRLYNAIWSDTSPHANANMVVLDGGGERCGFRVLERLEETLARSLGSKNGGDAEQRSSEPSPALSDDFTPHMLTREGGAGAAGGQAGGARTSAGAQHSEGSLMDVVQARVVFREEGPGAHGGASGCGPEWESASRSCVSLVECILSLLPLHGLEPVSGYSDVLARAVHMVVLRYLAQIEANAPRAQALGGVQVLYSAVCSLLLLYRVCVKVQASLNSAAAARPALWEGGVASDGCSRACGGVSDAPEHMDDCLAGRPKP